MSVELSLKAAPFHLNDEDITWVRKTRDGLSTEAKVRQLFVHISMGDDLDLARRLSGMAPGGIHRFMGHSRCLLQVILKAEGMDPQRCFNF
jgi:hypothetical protein